MAIICECDKCKDKYRYLKEYSLPVLRKDDEEGGFYIDELNYHLCKNCAEGLAASHSFLIGDKDTYDAWQNAQP